MGRKKITKLFSDYIRTGKADLEALSQLVLCAKGSRSMNDFANDCEVNTSTISRIINMNNTTACSDEVLVQYRRRPIRQVELHLSSCWRQMKW